SNGGRTHIVCCVGAPVLGSSCSAATLVIEFLYFSGVGVKKDLSTAGASFGSGSFATSLDGSFDLAPSLFLAKLPPSFDCGEPTPSFQRLVELLPEIDTIISRICRSV